MAYTPTTWVTGDTITATALNKIENGIAGAGGGGAYDFIIRKIGSGSPTLEEGTYSDVYNKLQNQEPVYGLYVENTAVGTYHDTSCYYVPITYIYYYSSLDGLFATGLVHNNTSIKRIDIEWYTNSISVSWLNP